MWVAQLAPSTLNTFADGFPYTANREATWRTPITLLSKNSIHLTGTENLKGRTLFILFTSLIPYIPGSIYIWRYSLFCEILEWKQGPWMMAAPHCAVGRVLQEDLIPFFLRVKPSAIFFDFTRIPWMTVSIHCWGSLSHSHHESVVYNTM